MRVWRGRPHPLGATWDGRGVNMAVFSETADRVELCLFDSVEATAESERIALTSKTGPIWHGYFPDLRPGQLYGLRASGPYDPASGSRFNVNKLLFDPYAKAVGRDISYHDSLYGFDPASPAQDLSFGAQDSAAHAPLSMVVDTAFSWPAATGPRRSLADTVVYELHVKGFTERHPGIPEPLRGTYAGLASSAAIEHLLDLGVNTVELLPVHYRVSEPFLIARGLSNYWGYNTLGFFAPDPRLAAATEPQAVLQEFKTMVAALHDAGIAVFLDVVYNHTAEASQTGPTLAFRGLDNSAYYHLADDRRFNYDVTGTGNSLNLGHPRTLQLVCDSLRYWASEMHIDGFRFDLAPELARQYRDYDQQAPFFNILLQDPTLAAVHLIAEPWDIGAGGYDVGNFPVNWSEWNGRYRDTMRRFWAGAPQQLSDLATRLAGSSDLYGDDGRRPTASINFITVHDGFTLADLVAYDNKHNEINQEHNNDGTNDNDSWNCGAEGPTSDPEINQLRDRQARNLLLTLLVSQGVPMLQAGDEIGRTQNGNNNAYCQDNDLTWLDWDPDARAESLLAFTKRVIALRAAEPVFRRRHFFQGRPINAALDGAEGLKDIYWISASGQEMQDSDWNSSSVDALGMLLFGDEIDESDEVGDPIVGDSFLVLFNGSGDGIDFALPARLSERTLTVEIDTSSEQHDRVLVADAYKLDGHSAVVIRVAPTIEHPKA